MIRFSCPRCGAIYEAALHRAGEKLHCLKCQQRLQVPDAALAKTIPSSPIAPKSIATDGCAPIPASSATPTSKALNSKPALPALDQRQPNETQQWYVAKGKQKLGPFKTIELQRLARENRILPTDMVHKEGTPKWIPASSIQGLFTTVSPTTLTAPLIVSVQPSDSSAAPTAAPFGMSRFVYWSSLIGGWSAFAGWAFTEVLIGRWVGRYFPLAVIMIMVVASAIGAGLSQVEALFTSQWQAQRQRFVPGLIGGLVGGLFGGLLGNVTYSLLGGELAFLAFLGRVLGWTLLGISIGICEGITKLHWRRFRNGLIGGSIGGFLGGLFFNPVSYLVGSPLSSRGFAFVLLGLFIGLFVGLVQVLLKEAWVTVEAGFRPGRQLILLDAITTMGTSEKGGLIFIAYGAKGVEPTHLRIHRTKDGEYILEDNQSRSGTFLNGVKVERPMRLRDGDVFRFGINIVRFHERYRPHQMQGKPLAAGEQA